MSRFKQSLPQPQAAPAEQYTNSDGKVVNLGNVIGRGGYGEVRFIEGDGESRIVKILLIDTKISHEIAINEAEKLRHLGTSPYTPTMICATRIGNKFYIEMENAGETIQDLMACNKQKPLNIKDTAMIANGLMKVLDHLHQMGMLHLDVKCPNVCVLKSIPWKVMIDFEAALFNREMLTVRRRIHTTAYLSPEGLLRFPLFKSTDIWSAGCILFRVFAGEHPFFAKDHATLYKLDVHCYGLLPPDYHLSLVYQNFQNLVRHPYEHDTDMEMIQDLAKQLRGNGSRLTELLKNFADLAIKLLTSDASKRPTASETAVAFGHFLEKLPVD